MFLQAKKTGKKALYASGQELQSAINEAKALEREVKSFDVLSDWTDKCYTIGALERS